MRQSKYVIPTLREMPSDAEAVSHQLLIKAGFIRQLAAGIYTYLPLGWRVLRKLENIVREEMDRTGAQAILMPAMQPVELWQQSGRYSLYGPELIRLHDRNSREFALGPTHEEVITSLIRDVISTYRKLPVIMYQVQTKFRDERRPRFGLLRGREFVMKDAYSFDTDWEGLDRSYQSMYDAYHRIFTRCGLHFRAVEADAGSIGGDGGTHEFMALADIGEDTVAACAHCDYSANLEMAECAPQAVASFDVEVPDYDKVFTPNIKTIDELVRFLGVKSEEIIKTLIYAADGQPIAVLVRGDHEVNENKLKNYMNAEQLELADAVTTEKNTGTPLGFIGPVGVPLRLIVDREVAGMNEGITGANLSDFHLRHVKPGRDFPLEDVGDFRNAKEGDLCPRCGGALQFYRGIEVGHVFKLGTKYSEPLGASFIDPHGVQKPMIMGCYGIGVSRLLSAVVEQSNDRNGIRWPLAIAPFHVHIIPVSVQDDDQMKAAEHLYRRLMDLGIEVLLDDREERAGVKFKDSDLIGIPIRIIAGKTAKQGSVEYKERGSEEQLTLSADDAIHQVVQRMKQG